MFTKIVPFSALVTQGRWKVEFFVPDRTTSRPTAYPLVRLKDVLTERREFLDPQQHPGHRFHYLGLEHVSPVTGDLADGYEPRPGRAVLSRSKVFRPGDLLYGRLRPGLNKVFVAAAPVAEGICSGEFYVLIPAPTLLPHFGRAALASRYVQDVVRSMTTGSALPRLALEDLLDIPIPLPPGDIQRGYEEQLHARAARRHQLLAELRDGPAADLDAIVGALEDGTEPDFGRPAGPLHPEFGEVKLPDETPPPRRGRPAGSSPRL